MFICTCVVYVHKGICQEKAERTYSGPPLYCPRYIATLAYRHEIVKNEFPPMLIPPL